MYIEFKKQIFLITVIVFTGYFLFADQVILKNGKHKNLNISNISAGSVAGNGQSIPLANIKEINFSASELPAKKSGIMLKDGSLLTGVIRKMHKKEIIFRSTAFGEIKLPLVDIAAMFFLGMDSAIKNINKARELPILIQSSGTKLTGEILWYDLKSTGILTKSGLKKVPTENLELVYFSKFNDKSRVVLRNGDRLPKPETQDGAFLKFRFGKLPITSIKKYEIDSGTNPRQKNKK